VFLAEREFIYTHLLVTEREFVYNQQVAEERETEEVYSEGLGITG
jgi:hypothetical protein